MAIGSNSPPNNSCRASCLVDKGTAKAAINFSTISASAALESTAIPSFCFRTFCAYSMELAARGFLAMRSLRLNVKPDLGVLDLLTLGPARMIGVCRGMQIHDSISS